MSYEQRVMDWALKCFPLEVISSHDERCKRFIEEALELVQACGLPREAAHSMVDYVFDRPVGNSYQEVGGVMVCLALLCKVFGMSMKDAGEDELWRIWQNIDKIRAKQQAKPEHIAHRVS